MLNNKRPNPTTNTKLSSPYCKKKDFAKFWDFFSLFSICRMFRKKIFVLVSPIIWYRAIFAKKIAWFRMISHDFAWFRMNSHEFAWIRMNSHEFAWLVIIPHDFAWFRLISLDFAWISASFRMIMNFFIPHDTRYLYQ